MVWNSILIWWTYFPTLVCPLNDLILVGNYTNIQNMLKELTDNVMMVSFLWVIWEFGKDKGFYNLIASDSIVVYETLFIVFLWVNSHEKIINLHWIDWCCHIIIKCNSMLKVLALLFGYTFICFD